MSAARLLLAAAAAAIGLAPISAWAGDVEEKTAFEHAIPNIPGKSLVALVVTYAPGVKSGSHRHAGSAFIYARVLSGSIRSQVNDEPARVYKAGEGWHELPGSHHRVSENASDSDPASLLAVFVVDIDDRPLTTPDRH
jgi:quercetin dioxygenase-like cupin family protein